MVAKLFFVGQNVVLLKLLPGIAALRNTGYAVVLVYISGAVGANRWVVSVNNGVVTPSIEPAHIGVPGRTKAKIAQECDFRKHTAHKTIFGSDLFVPLIFQVHEGVANLCPLYGQLGVKGVGRIHQWGNGQHTARIEQQAVCLAKGQLLAAEVGVDAYF